MNIQVHLIRGLGLTSIQHKEDSMANYAVTDFVQTFDTAEQAAAYIETSVETLDSTNNPIVVCTIIMTADKRFTAILVA